MNKFRFLHAWTLVIVAAITAGCGGEEAAAPIEEPTTEPVAAAPAPEPEAPAESPEPKMEPTPEPEAPATPPPAKGVNIGDLVLDLELAEPVDIVTLPESEIVEGTLKLDGAIVKASLLGPAGLTPGFGEEESLRKLTDEWLASVEQVLADPDVLADDSGSTSEAEENYGQVQTLEAGVVSGFYVSAQLREAGADGLSHIVNGYFRVGDGVVMFGGVHNGSAEAKILETISTAKWNSAAQ